MAISFRVSSVRSKSAKFSTSPGPSVRCSCQGARLGGVEKDTAGAPSLFAAGPAASGESASAARAGKLLAASSKARHAVQ